MVITLHRFRELVPRIPADKQQAAAHDCIECVGEADPNIQLEFKVCQPFPEVTNDGRPVAICPHDSRIP